MDWIIELLRTILAMLALAMGGGSPALPTPEPEPTYVTCISAAWVDADGVQHETGVTCS